MENPTIKSSIKILVLFCLTALLFSACKKKDPFKNHETYFKGTVGNTAVDFKSSFFYAEGGYTTYQGVGTIGTDEIGITLNCTDGGITRPDGSGDIYEYDVDGHTEQRFASAVLVLVSTNNPNISGLSYYVNCNGRTINSEGNIEIGNIEKVGNQEYITGSFTGTVYKELEGDCNYAEQPISIKFRVPNRRLFGDGGD